MTDVLRVLWFLLALGVAAGAAFLFRYQPLDSGAQVFVWDRWKHRPCIAALGLKGSPACTPEEIKRLKY
jgi:hypothetical protein